MSDYLPSNILKFMIFVRNIRAQVAINYSRWGISSSEYSVLDPLIAALDAAILISENPVTRTSAAIRKRDEARDALEVELRPFIQGRLMNNRRVTDDDKIALGLHVRDHKPTPSPDPDDTPAIETRAAAPGVIEVIFGGKNEKGHAKPYGYHGIEVRHLVGDKDHPPVNWSELIHSSFATRSPMKFTFEGLERGRWFYFAARWENTRGVKGPWTEIFAIIIP
jgi:hypothetical protein